MDATPSPLEDFGDKLDFDTSPRGFVGLRGTADVRVFLAENFYQEFRSTIGDEVLLRCFPDRLLRPGYTTDKGFIKQMLNACHRRVRGRYQRA